MIQFWKKNISPQEEFTFPTTPKSSNILMHILTRLSPRQLFISGLTFWHGDTADWPPVGTFRAGTHWGSFVNQPTYTLTHGHEQRNPVKKKRPDVGRGHICRSLMLRTFGGKRITFFELFEWTWKRVGRDQSHGVVHCCFGVKSKVV